MDSGDLNSGLHSGMASPLTDQSSLHPCLVALDHGWKPASCMYPCGTCKPPWDAPLRSAASLVLRSMLPCSLVLKHIKPTFPLFSTSPSLVSRPYPAHALAGPHAKYRLCGFCTRGKRKPGLEVLALCSGYFLDWGRKNPSPREPGQVSETSFQTKKWKMIQW